MLIVRERQRKLIAQQVIKWFVVRAPLQRDMVMLPWVLELRLLEMDRPIALAEQRRWGRTRMLQELRLWLWVRELGLKSGNPLRLVMIRVPRERVPFPSAVMTREPHTARLRLLLRVILRVVLPIVQPTVLAMVRLRLHRMHKH